MMKEARGKASAAKEIAVEARSIVKELRTDVGKLQETSVTKAQVQSMVDTAVKTAVDTKPQSVGKITNDSDNPTTIVIGGLENRSFLEANDGMRRRLKELHLPEPLEAYHKGDDFTGVLFMTFTTAEAARQAVQKLQKKPLNAGNKDVWCKLDRSIYERTRISVLLGLRRQLHLWGSYQKSLMRVNETDFSMSVGKERVISADIDDNKVKLTWHSAEWDRWSELKESAELHELVHTANTKLSKATTTTTKGKGKAAGAPTAQQAA